MVRVLTSLVWPAVGHVGTLLWRHQVTGSSTLMRARCSGHVTGSGKEIRESTTVCLCVAACHGARAHLSCMACCRARWHATVASPSHWQLHAYARTLLRPRDWLGQRNTREHDGMPVRGGVSWCACSPLLYGLL